MRRLSSGRGMGPRRLKAAVLAAIDARIAACRQAEDRYTAMACEPNGGVLGSVEMAVRSASTERSARMEAELIRRHVADLPVRGEG